MQLNFPAVVTTLLTSVFLSVLPGPQLSLAVANTEHCVDYTATNHYRPRSNQIVLSPDDDWQEYLNYDDRPQSNDTRFDDTEFLLQDGVYDLTRYALVISDNITIRSLSGNRDKVILRGQGYGQGSEGLMLAGDNITIADISITGMRDHGVSIKNELGSQYAPHLYNLHLYDIGTQHIKLTPGGTQDGLVACSMIGYTLGGAVGDYNGAIDLHEAINWTLRDNLIYNLRGDGSGCVVDTWCGTFISAPAILVWSDSAGTITKRNRIVNSYRNIAYGLGEGHQGGEISDNIIEQQTAGDAGIELQDAHDVLVTDNQVILGAPYQASPYPGAIEYRQSTNLQIANNAVSGENTSTMGLWDRNDNNNVSLTSNTVKAYTSNLCDVDSANLQLSLPPDQWTLMALPCQPPMGSTLHSIFSDDVQGTYGTDWIAFFYSPDTGYSAIDPHNQYHVPLGGTGFWFIHTGTTNAVLDLPAGTTRRELSLEQPCLSQASGCAITTLHNTAGISWSLSGNPLDSVVDMSDTSVADTDHCSRQEHCTLTSANDASVVHHSFYRYANDSYQALSQAAISPWSGFWAIVLANAEQPKLFWPAPDDVYSVP